MKKRSVKFLLTFFTLISLISCLTVGRNGRRYSLDARQTWGPTQHSLPIADDALLKKDPILYYQIAQIEGRFVETSVIVNALFNLLDTQDVKNSAFKRLHYLQSLQTLGAVGLTEIQQASIDFVREIAHDYSPGVAIAMLGRFVPLSWLNEEELSYFKDLADQHEIHIPGLQTEGSHVAQLSKKDWFDGVVTVWVRAGYLMERGLSFPKMSLGTGFFIDKKGYFVTNYHVIAPYIERQIYSGFSEITVEPAGSKVGFRLPVKVVGYNKETDLALLKVEGYEPKVAFSFADRADIHTGDRVYALGSPGGQTETLTSGLISHTDRRMVMPIGSVIQLDAAVNPGNSGGPMLNEQGNISGVIFATHQSFQGLSFALPTDTVRTVLPLLMMAEGKSARLPFTGIGMTEVDNGVEASLVMRNSLIERAGISSGAQLLEVAGMIVDTSPNIFADLQLGLLQRFANSLIKVVFEQDNETYEVVTRLAPRTNEPALDVMRTTPVYFLYGPMFGLLLKPLSSRMMYVQKVYPGSDAAMAGIKSKDTLMIYDTVLTALPGRKEPAALISIFRVTLETDAGMPRNMVLAGPLDANYWL